jgi:hypothetical protein
MFCIKVPGDERDAAEGFPSWLGYDPLSNGMLPVLSATLNFWRISKRAGVVADPDNIEVEGSPIMTLLPTL